MILNKNYKPGKYEKKYFTKEHKEKYGYDYEVDPGVIVKHVDRLDRLLEYRESGSLLEIGAAFGEFIGLADRFFDCIGIDISEYACNNSFDRVDNLDFMKINTEFGVFHPFDIVCSFFTLEHIDFLAALDKIHSFLNSGGLFYFDVPLLSDVDVNKMNSDHFVEFSGVGLADLLKDHGFNIIGEFKEKTTISLICTKID